MSLSDEIEIIRTAVESLGEAKTARRYDADFRRRLARLTRARLREGATLKEVSKAVDVSRLSLQRFLDEVPELVPVRIVDGPASPERATMEAVTAPMPATSSPPMPARLAASARLPLTTAAAPFSCRTITVHGPRGLRIEGLTVDDVVALFERMAPCSV